MTSESYPSEKGKHIKEGVQDLPGLETSNLEADTLKAAPSPLANVLPPIKVKKEGITRSLSRHGWSTITSFAVDFQIQEFEDQCKHRVHVQHVESAQEKSFSKLDDEDLYAWIMDHVAESRSRLLVDEQSYGKSSTTEITQVRFLQPVSVSGGIEFNATFSSSNFLYSCKPVALEVSFRVLGITISDAENQAIACHIQGKFHNLNTCEDFPVKLNQPSPLVEGQHSYTVRLPEVKLPPGPYQLEVAATLDNVSVPAAILHVPVLQVI